MTLHNAFEALSTEATLAALKGVADSILTASANIEAAVEALNAKVTEVDTAELATDATAAAIRDMTDTIVTALQGIQSRLARLNKSGVLEVTHDPALGAVTVLPTNGVGTNWLMGTNRSLQDVTSLTVCARSHEPFQFSNMGALHLYDKITVS